MASIPSWARGCVMVTSALVLGCSVASPTPAQSSPTPFSVFCGEFPAGSTYPHSTRALVGSLRLMVDRSRDRGQAEGRATAARLGREVPAMELSSAVTIYGQALSVLEPRGKGGALSWADPMHGELVQQSMDIIDRWLANNCT